MDVYFSSSCQRGPVTEQIVVTGMPCKSGSGCHPKGLTYTKGVSGHGKNRDDLERMVCYPDSLRHCGHDIHGSIANDPSLTCACREAADLGILVKSRRIPPEEQTNSLVWKRAVATSAVLHGKETLQRAR